MNTDGVLAESKVQSDLIEKGFTLSIPLQEVRYDLIAEKDAEIYRVQVKTPRQREDTNGESVKCSVMRGRSTNDASRKYEIDDFDILAVWAEPWDETAYKAWTEQQWHWTLRQKSEELSGQGSWKVNFISEQTLSGAIRELK